MFLSPPCISMGQVHHKHRGAPTAKPMEHFSTQCDIHLVIHNEFLLDLCDADSCDCLNDGQQDRRPEERSNGRSDRDNQYAQWMEKSLPGGIVQARDADVEGWKSERYGTVTLQSSTPRTLPLPSLVACIMRIPESRSRSADAVPNATNT